MTKPTRPMTATPALARSRLPVWQMAALLGLVTLALFWPATSHDFVNYDDPGYVLDNAHVNGGLTLKSVPWAFFHLVSANWHPLTMLSHMLDCELFGLNPWGHHLTSVLLHALNAVLVFLLFWRTTGATWRSLLVAALFALHPLRVESVAWVAERKDVLSGCFGLLTLIFYARYARQRSTRNPQPATRSYALALTFFAFGLMSKPMLVTWPFVMLLLDYWPLNRMRNAECGVRSQRSSVAQPPAGRERGEGGSTLNSQLSTIWRLMAEKLPFFVLSAVVSFVTFVTQQRGGAVMAIEKLPLGERTGNALISYCRYLEKLFWPTDLAVFYPYPEHWPVAQVFLAGGLLLGVSVWALMLRRRFPYLLTGWLWFVGTLVPVIGLVQVGEQAMADRYTYLPSLGMLVLAIWGAGELAGRGRYAVRTLALAGCAAVVLCLALTRHQLESWWNSETLFRHALAVTENNGTAHSNLGFALVKDGRTDEAIHHFQEALRINPKDAGAYNNLGNALIGQGQLDEGIQSYQQALRLTPEDAQIHNSLGSAYVKQGNLDAAIQHFQQGLRFTPNDAEIHNHLGDALARKGRLDAAIDQFREALRLKPDDPTAHYNLAIALGKQGNLNVAIEQFQAALLVQPDYPAARSNLAIALAQKSRFDNSIRGEAPRSQPDDREARHKLGMALVNQGRMDEAIREFQAALRLRPNDAAAHKNLGLALAMKGQIDEAINHFQDATRLNPDDPETLYNLGLALEKRGRIDEAIGQYQQVLRLKPEYADACNNLGYLWAERGENLDQARALIEKAVQVQPQNAGFLDSLAWVLLKQKRPREALGYGLKAVEKSAQPDAGIYDHLGDIYAALNQREQAAGAWRKSLAAAPNPQVQKKVGELSPH